METTYVLLKPLLTEKTTLLKDEAQQVAFDVKVEAVNVVRRAPSVRERQGRVVGRKPGWKKAYVTLRQGDKIEFFEGV